MQTSYIFYSCIAVVSVFVFSFDVMCVVFVLPSPSKFRGTTDNFVHWSINAIARINIFF